MFCRFGDPVKATPPPSLPLATIRCYACPSAAKGAVRRRRYHLVPHASRLTPHASRLTENLFDWISIQLFIILGAIRIG